MRKVHRMEKMITSAGKSLLSKTVWCVWMKRWWILSRVKYSGNRSQTETNPGSIGYLPNQSARRAWYKLVRLGWGYDGHSRKRRWRFACFHSDRYRWSGCSAGTPAPSLFPRLTVDFRNICWDEMMRTKLDKEIIGNTALPWRILKINRFSKR